MEGMPAGICLTSIELLCWLSHFLCLVLGGRPSEETCKFSCLACCLVTLGKWGKDTSGWSLSLADVLIELGDSSPAAMILGRWLRSCLPCMADAVSCITVGVPPLSCLGLADSGTLSEGDSSAVLKSEESDWASWMYC